MHKTKESLSALHKAIIGQKPVDLEDEKVMQTLIEKNQQWIKTEKERSRTARLWLNYMEQVSLIKLCIYAERTGDWVLHLNSIRQIIPYFHAAGHLAYAKSARIYPQQMQALQSTMNETEFGKFTKTGYFTIRRKDNLWGGIFSDQSIEQNLMRLLKTPGTQSIQYKSHREKHRRNVELSSRLYAEKPETPKAEIENAREEFLLKLYGFNKLGSTLDKLKQAIEKSSLTSTIKLESLPPTSAAAAQHSLRAYHQVQSTDLAWEDG
ncbi:hypothetical protein CAPTEDRAFT_211864 [Capitella teleta]|uniref:Uncharacterized protein n=1 Tax=Capitella teleta TaxID=283909 RepID=R7V4T4_CAPTE|nr:hypothetical protein CAPTEDRAFT_211864 [Capitella teleta]|eukprot:ELU11371.1 hypothetical protein CAPTEDRAFT_211864 [Capitella teleta]